MQQPNSRLGRLFVEVSSSHTFRHLHTPCRNPLNSDQLVAEAATYTAHNKRKTARFEPATPAIKQLHTYARTASRIGSQV